MKKLSILIALTLSSTACGNEQIQEVVQSENTSVVETEAVSSVEDETTKEETAEESSIEEQKSRYEERIKIEEQYYSEMPATLQTLIDVKEISTNLNSYTFSPDNKKIAYIHKYEIHLYDIETKKDELLLSIYNDTIDISTFVWSPSLSKIAFVVYNSSYQHSDYPEQSKVFVLTFKDGLTAKDKYNIYIPTSTPCSDRGCSPYKFEFVDENTLHYYTNKNGEGVDWTLENLQDELVEKFIEV